jgi:hypothetical protein
VRFRIIKLAPGTPDAPETIATVGTVGAPRREAELAGGEHAAEAEFAVGEPA